ncbi:16S rRNA (uracil(1498)-N(3))-methyltransferase [Carboxylicivirga sediminis]|uniref:Ribosomal RNA small subunit methyltransferase E n=1 Tax=Carboxylicivirga sediminis TaxID=2006564 RepID=A0A941F1D2_9BACT|nr:16S rRNA (uracil(1498)-N(3))-methyltransferase [Carboxylicivirga sediminis]MBR8534609.1 16S rRNA (uracil(1498)-N(3))-methyltransferase [Carboxylicivirga sediminis]
MELFFDPKFDGNGILNEVESKHCINVLRHKAGDKVTVANGKGQYYSCQIINPHPKRCELELINTENFPPRPYKIHLAVAPTKSIDRFEWMIEKAMELGVDEITPLLCQHSERKKIRTDRIERVVIAAMKQSLKAYLPKINELTPFDVFIKQLKDSKAYIAHCYESNKRPLKLAYQAQSNCILCIGPEGDFSEQEVEMAVNANFQPVSLGSSRLRTETAGVVACHTIHLLND